MNVLVIGGGAREHALVWKLGQSPQVRKIYCSPGNGGIGEVAELVRAGDDSAFYSDFAVRQKIDLTVVGPEVPLVGGLVDVFLKKGLKVFGPDAQAARLEGSKIFSKQFMRRHGLPTADFEAFDDSALAFAYVDRRATQSGVLPCVVKADGLAAGKGVTVCDTAEEARAAVETMMVKKVFGEAGERILIEERLAGPEVSLMAFCDGKTIRPLPPARDYKRVNDADQGPNTGGMGAICPCPVDPAVLEQIQGRIVHPFLEAVKKEGMHYRGLIYFGLMLTAKGPYVLEFNVRFGDPETQSILPLIAGDPAELFLSTVEQRLDRLALQVEPAACVGVVCASGGYPGKFENGKEIRGLETLKEEKDLFVFHAGTVRQNGRLLTQGGRVLTVVGRAQTLKEAKRKAYGAVFKLDFEKMHYRSDIGK